MGVYTEWLTDSIGILRIGSKFCEFGDSYDLACTVIKKGEDTLEIKGASTSFFTNIVVERDNLRSILKPIGILWVTWNRIKDGIIKEVKVKI